MRLALAMLRWSVIASSVFSLAPGCDSRPAMEGTSGSEPTAHATPRRDILSTEKNRYSQHGEELVVRDFFQDRRGGFFLDVGCAWPVNYSNTYFLEKELGWSGIGVDAVIDHARRWRNRRHASRFFNYIVTDHSGTVETFYKTARGDLLGVSKTTPGPGPGGGPLDYEEVQVPTITLTDLLDQNGVEKIDFLSMDIEGAEPVALSGFDIERFQPKLVVVEVHGETREAIIQYFTEHDYERIERYDDADPYNLHFEPRPR